MARPTPQLIDALHTTAKRLKAGAEYQWTHMGACNCGHLAQTITRKPKAEIHALALEKAGDWADKAIDYCALSGYPIDHVIGEMIELGLSKEDIADLERLSNTTILQRIAAEHRPIQYRNVAHVVLYLEAWAALLEEQLLAKLELPKYSVRNISTPVIA